MASIVRILAELPASLTEDMSRIEPSKMRVLSPEELARYRLD